MSLEVHVRHALAGAAAVALTAGAGCSHKGPAPYVAPKPGTVYHYTGGLTNTITAVDGYRTTYTDNAGRKGSRLALFISEDPGLPAQPDSGALERLWPLEVGRELSFRTKVGQEVYRWEFRVTARERVTTPAGEFDAYLVQGVRTPELVANPRGASTVANSWWYSPERNAVVQFRSRYLAGPSAGHTYQAALERIDSVGTGS